MTKDAGNGAEIIHRGFLGRKFRNANAWGHDTSCFVSFEKLRWVLTSRGLEGRNDHAIPHRRVVPWTNSVKA